MIKIEFEFPDTGEGVTEGKFLEWKVEEGEEIEEDQVVGEAETDKAVVEIPSPSDGTVEELKAEPGDQVEVGEVIMDLETDAEEPEDKVEEKENEEESEDEEKEEPEKQGLESQGETRNRSSADVLALPKVRKLAEEKNVDLESIDSGDRITEEDVIKASKSSEAESSPEREDNEEKVNASPSVRQLAREKEVDIQKIEGSGRGGKVTREDVLEASGSAEETSEIDRDYRSQVERVEMSGTRRKIAEKMTESKFTAPHVTHVEKADITELADMQHDVENEIEAHLTYLPFIMKASVKALKDYPEVNAEIDEENNEIIRKKYYDFNIAVDTDRGLLVPRIDDVDDKDMVELGEDIVEKAEAAQDGELGREEMTPGTFSITNIGVIGGEEFTPIINYPQVAILGVGRIGETAEVVDGEVAPRTTVKLSLSYDHRVVDGATAARFMNDLVENLENPEELIVSL